VHAKGGFFHNQREKSTLLTVFYNNSLTPRKKAIH
jgi:hypothetical protein